MAILVSLRPQNRNALATAPTISVGSTPINSLASYAQNNPYVVREESEDGSSPSSKSPNTMTDSELQDSYDSAKFGQSASGKLSRSLVSVAGLIGGFPAAPVNGLLAVANYGANKQANNTAAVKTARNTIRQVHNVPVNPAIAQFQQAISSTAFGRMSAAVAANNNQSMGQGALDAMMGPNGDPDQSLSEMLGKMFGGDKTGGDQGNDPAGAQGEPGSMGNPGEMGMGVW